MLRQTLTLEKRKNHVQLDEELYHYDPLNRLKQVERKTGLQSPETINYGYDLAGNLTKKTDFTVADNAYLYGNETRSAHNAGPNAVTQVALKGFSDPTYRFYEYDLNGNIIRSTQGADRNSAQGFHTITYNSNNKPTRIDDVNKGKFERFWYGSDGMRYKQITSEGVVTYYVDGTFEHVTQNNETTTKAYIGDYAVVTRTQNSKALSYLHKDRLGSVETITDGDNTADTVTDRNQDGTTNVMDLILEQRLYDVFGEARPKDDGNPNNDPWMIKGITSHGFTGHEHLQSGLIHMNGRAYDPAIGRFLSVDPFIVMPENGQSINPYSYVMNNPLKYTDPSGYKAKGVQTTKIDCTGQECSDFIEKLKNSNVCKNGCTMVGKTLEGELFVVRVKGNGSSPQSGQSSNNSEPKQEKKTTRTTSLTDSEGNVYNPKVVNMGAATPEQAAGLIQGVNFVPGEETDKWLDSDQGKSFWDSPWGWMASFASGEALLAVGFKFASYFSKSASVGSKVGGSIRGVNKVGGKQNCANCSIATDATLAGNPASALNSGLTNKIEVAAHFGRKFGSMTSLTRIEAQMAKAGNGSRGVIFAAREGKPGHFFNVVNQNGTVRFLDGQTGKAFSSQGQNFIGYQLLKTN